MRSVTTRAAILLSLAVWPASCVTGPAPTFTLQDGATVNADQLGYVAKNRRLLNYLKQSKDYITIFTSPPSCPSYYFYSYSTTSYNPNLETHRAQCSRAVAARMADYSERAQRSCRCITFAEGQSGKGFRVEVNDEFARDTMLTSIATIMETRGNSRSRLRGFMRISLSSGDFELLNESLVSVCTGRVQIGGSKATLSCFHDSLQLSGTYQSGESSGRLYGIGRFQAPEGMKLDFAVNLTDRELTQQRPNFPD